MDKLLGILGELLKSITIISPVAGVLLLLLLAAGWAIRYLFLQIRQLQQDQLTQHENFQVKLTAALSERETEYRRQLEAKEAEITTLHERNFERDQASGKTLEQLRLTIARSNQAPILNSTWNGIHAICQYHKIDGRAIGLWNHMNQIITNPEVQ